MPTDAAGPETGLVATSTLSTQQNLRVSIAHTAVMCGLAENPALPPDLVDVLIRCGDEEILTDLASREDLTDQQLENLAGSPASSRRECRTESDRPIG